MMNRGVLRGWRDEGDGKPGTIEDYRNPITEEKLKYRQSLRTVKSYEIWTTYAVRLTCDCMHAHSPTNTSIHSIFPCMCAHGWLQHFTTLYIQHNLVHPWSSLCLPLQHMALIRREGGGQRRELVKDTRMSA